MRRSRRCAQRLSASLFVPRSPAVSSGSVRRVLNAFRHHCSFHVVSPASIIDRNSVLNAFRHHCSFHTASPSLERAREKMCSTPFGIIVRSTRHDQTRVSDETWCSTPFGIIVRSTRRLPARLESQCQPCSTPFGIIVRSTVVWDAEDELGDGCSTPFGIIVRSTTWWNCGWMASRWCSTPFGIIVRSTRERPNTSAGLETCAQRLSASLFVPPALAAANRTTASGCSTPFGIIVRSTRTTDGWVKLSAEVLNAFRHHCSFHAGLINDNYKSPATTTTFPR